MSLLRNIVRGLRRCSGGLPFATNKPLCSHAVRDSPPMCPPMKAQISGTILR
jgi:hypothetical protein